MKRYIKKLEATYKDKAGVKEFTKLRKEYIKKLEAAYKEKCSEEALNKLKKKYDLDIEAGFIKEAVDKDKKDKVKEIKKRIETYTLTVEDKYEMKIGLKRLNLENYKLFSDHKKKSEHKIEGGLNISQETGDDPGKEAKFNVVVSEVAPKANGKEESKDKEKKKKENHKPKVEEKGEEKSG
ncbi:MAG: hypothetical protein KAW12_00340 [Candidatus Aminicenantes bacterium]|nr:hypothetical protein [Candidatus Aminicenantes bacterium]